MTMSRRELRALRGFVFDLDGCVWTGDILVPGAAEVLALLRQQGRRVSFLTNNSRARSATMQAKLERLGVEAAVEDVLTPLEILGDAEAGKAGKVRGMRCIRMALGEPDASGRRRPVPLPDSEFFMPADTVLCAIGEEADPDALPEGLVLAVDVKTPWAVRTLLRETKRRGIAYGVGRYCPSSNCAN